MKIKITYKHYAIIDGKEYYLNSSNNMPTEFITKKEYNVKCDFCNAALTITNNDPDEAKLIISEHEKNCTKNPANNICPNCKNRNENFENDPNQSRTYHTCKKKMKCFNKLSKNCEKFIHK